MMMSNDGWLFWKKLVLTMMTNDRCCAARHILSFFFPWWGNDVDMCTWMHCSMSSPSPSNFCLFFFFVVKEFFVGYKNWLNCIFGCGICLRREDKGRECLIPRTACSREWLDDGMLQVVIPEHVLWCKLLLKNDVRVIPGSTKRTLHFEEEFS